MTIREAIYDLRKFLASYELVEESKLTLGYCNHLISTNRSFIITEDFYRHAQLDQQIFQSLGIKNVSRVSFSDELDDDDKCYVGKFEIPIVVQVRSDRQRISDLGINMIKSTAGKRYHRTTQKKFVDMMSYGDKRLDMGVFWHVGQSIFIYPYREEATGSAALENILDGKVIQTGLVDSLVIGKSYKVKNGTIVHNSQTLQSNDVFTAVSPTWTGSGTVTYGNDTRDYTLDDEAPMNANLWGYVKQRILKELTLGSKLTGDTVHDGADEESMRESRQ